MADNLHPRGLEEAASVHIGMHPVGELLGSREASVSDERGVVEQQRSLLFCSKSFREENAFWETLSSVIRFTFNTPQGRSRLQVHH